MITVLFFPVLVAVVIMFLVYTITHYFDGQQIRAPSSSHQRWQGRRNICPYPSNFICNFIIIYSNKASGGFLIEAYSHDFWNRLTKYPCTIINAHETCFCIMYITCRKCIYCVYISIVIMNKKIYFQNKR